MTLRQFARAAGTSASRLSDYEHAKVAPTTDVLGAPRPRLLLVKRTGTCSSC